VVPVVQFVLGEFPAQRVAVNPEYARGARAVALYPVENTLDETFFEFSYGLVKEDAVLHHLTYEPFQLILQFSTLQKVNHHDPRGLI
jgi:hypothetical protein